MTTPLNTDFDVSATDQTLGLPNEQANLQPFITIQPPAGSDSTSPVLAFRRKRRVDVPWKEILGSSATVGNTSIASIREYFEDSWGLGAIDETNLTVVTGGVTARIKALETAGTDDKGKPAPKPMFRANLDEVKSEDESQPAAVGVESGLIVQHGTSGRCYLMISRADESLSMADLESIQSYDKMWTNKVDGVELVFESVEAAEDGFTEFSEVDLRPRVIHRAFNELLIHKNFVENVSTSAAEATKNAVKEITDTNMDVDELQRLQEKSFQLQIQAYEANRRLDRLVSQAADLGYYLFLESKEFVFPGGKKTKVGPGEIYTQFKRTATWVTTHYRNITQTSGWWIFKSSKTTKQAYTQRKSKVVTDYQKVDTARDPLVEAVAQYRAKGNAVFVFEQGALGFITADGVPLREVMQQCDRNERFRKSCVILLPVYEESLTGDRVLSKYSVFERPLPGISPGALPQFSLLESLSYRTGWKESQLGELVSSINLAPGEDRTVVLTKVFEQESSVTRSSTSIFDISRSDTNDLATEMENQARVESEQSSNMNFSATGSASYGFFSAEASASGGSSASLKSFSQAISKVAKKASQSVNQRNREEVSTSSSLKTTVSNKDETTATMRNINQGRTLNLLFYRLNNRFTGGIYLDDLQFEVIPSMESIAGSGVYESLRFALDEMPEMLEQFQQTRLPFDIVSHNGGKTSFLQKVVGSLKSLLEKEYMNGGPQRTDAGVKATRRFSGELQPDTATSIARVRLGPAPARTSRRISKSAATATALDNGIDAELVEFVGRLRHATIDRNTPILSDDLILASGGLYLDTVVGALASTEPYSEAMRKQEIRMRDAEVRKTLAEAEHQHALAASVETGDTVGVDGNWIIGLFLDSARKSLRLRLHEPLTQGQWDLMLDDTRKATIKANMNGQKDLIHRWRGPQEWFKEKDLIHRITLEKKDSGERVEFLK